MIKKIHHVGIVVRNVEQAFAFYRDALGLPVGKMDTIPDQGVKAALLPVGHSEIELLEPIRDDTGVARFLATRGEGMHHICFESDDVDRELEELKAKDAQLIDQQSRPGLAGMVAFMHPRCTHKTLVELATPPSGAAAHPAAGAGAGVKDLHYVTLAVADADAAAADYRRLFGLQGGEPFELGDVGGKGVMLPIGGAFLELLAATGPDTRVGRIIAEAGEGMLMLTLEVASLDKAIAYLRSQGAQVGDAAAGPLPNMRSARLDPSSTHGVRLQLVER